MRRGRTWPWIRMRPFLARFSELVWSGHLASWADFITTTPELEFSVHTQAEINRAKAAEQAQSLRRHLERCIEAGRTWSSAIAADLDARGIRRRTVVDGFGCRARRRL